MNLNPTSKLRPYSLGLVTKDKPRDEVEIEVMPIEEFSFHEGVANSDTVAIRAKGEDHQGQAYQTSVGSSISIKATWLPVGAANRLTPPNVQTGEQVMIYQFEGDQDRYYWNTLRNDLRFRQLESVVYAFKAKPDADEAPGPDNVYFLEVSAHDRKVHFSNSKANGEEFRYDILLDMAESVFKIQDDIGNRITLDSRAKQIRLENASGNWIDLIDNVLNIHANDQINMTTSAWSVKADTTSLVSETNTIKSETTHTGDITNVGSTMQNGTLAVTKLTTLMGGLVVSGSGARGPSAKITGDMDIVGNLDSSGKITNNGVAIDSTHTHTDAEGRKTSTPN